MSKPLLLPTLVFALLGACKSERPSVAPHEPQDQVLAKADLHDGSGNIVGTATFTATQTGAAIDVEINQLPPGPHGFHIHETGACEAPDFKSAGGHFNPLGAKHGLADGDAHLGDLTNLSVDENGEAKTRILVEGVNLESEGARSLLSGDGTALVVHADADDYETDPAGAAGPRIACGVIKPR